MIFILFFIYEGDCAVADSPIFKSEESFEEMSSAKYFFLKPTERDRPTVKLTASSRGQSYFLKKRQGNTVRSRVGPSLQEVTGKCNK